MRWTVSPDLNTEYKYEASPDTIKVSILGGAFLTPQ
ncbi:hypothetical protein ACUXHY_004331 [Cytobacillus horneckiae]